MELLPPICSLCQVLSLKIKCSVYSKQLVLIVDYNYGHDKGKVYTLPFFQISFIKQNEKLTPELFSISLF